MILKNKNVFKILKIFLEFLIISLFISGYLKIYSTLQNNFSIRLVFSIVYIWFTIGMNVNFIVPLLKLINNKINKY